MRHTIFIFHGTEGYPEENWFPWLKARLEEKGQRVFVPQFPSPPDVPAKISEWFNALKACEQFIDQNTILIGHSLGGVFALRILEKLDHPVYASIFVGTPIGIQPIANYDRDNSFSGFNFDWKRVVENAGQTIVFQSDNDPYVGLENGKQLAQNIKTDLTFIPGAGHFNQKAGYTRFNQLLEKLSPIIQ